MLCCEIRVGHESRELSTFQGKGIWLEETLSYDLLRIES